MASSRLDLYLEAERRGILPQDKAVLLQEARNRGLIAPLGEDMNPLTRVAGRVGRTSAAGVASIPDLAHTVINRPVYDAAAYVADQLGAPQTAARYREIAAKNPSEEIKRAIDSQTDNKLKPRNGLERIADTAGEFVVGGGGLANIAGKVPALADSALAQFGLRDLAAAAASGGAYQGAEELGGNEYVKLAAAAAAPVATLSAAPVAIGATRSVKNIINNFGKSGIPQRAEQELLKTLAAQPISGNVPLGAQQLPDATLQRGQEAISRTPEAEQLAIQKLQQTEKQKRGAISIKGVMGEAESTKTSAETIKDSLDEARKAVTKPLYKEAFQTNDVFDASNHYKIVPETPPVYEPNAGMLIKTGSPARVEKSPGLAKLESSDAFREAKNAVLDRASPEDIARGYYRPKEDIMSSQMLNDIHSELRNYASSAERSISEGAAKDSRSYTRAANQTYNVLKAGMPEAKFAQREKASALYQGFSKKIESIFGSNDRGLVGNLLKFDELDAQSTEKVINQMNALFQKEPQKILDVKNTFKEFGQEKQFDKAFSAYLQYNTDKLPAGKTLYDYFSKNKLQARQFYSSLPKGQQANAKEVIRLGRNLDIMRNKAFEQKVGMGDAVQAAGRLAAPKTGGMAQIATNFYNKYSGKNAIDKEIINILFDKQRSKEFLSNMNQLKTDAEKQKYLMDYFMKYGNYQKSLDAATVRTGAQAISREDKDQQ